MATNVSRDQILDGIVGKVSALRPATGSSLTVAQYVHSVGRIMGKLDSTAEAFQRGIAGRCPALLVGVDGNPRRVKTTIGRRVDRVETGVKVIACSDKQKSRDSRSLVLRLCEDVRRLVAARRLGLQIQPLMFAGESVEMDNEELLCVAVKFTTKHRVDYTLTGATYDPMLTAYGRICWPDDADGTPGRLRGEMDVIFP